MRVYVLAYRAAELTQHVIAIALLDDALDAAVQSIAILEYLNEIYPEPPLLPADPRGRARVRALSLITVADSHPLIVPRVRNHLAAAAQAPRAGIEGEVIEEQTPVDFHRVPGATVADYSSRRRR